MLTGRGGQGLAGLYNSNAVRRRTWNQPLKKKTPKLREGGEAAMEVPRKPNSQLQARAKVPGVPPNAPGSHPQVGSPSHCLTVRLPASFYI